MAVTTSMLTFSTLATVLSLSPHVVSLHPLKLLADQHVDGRDLTAAEFFAGVMAISRGFNAEGQKCIPVDILMDPGNKIYDFLTDQGFRHALKLILRIRPGGLIWF